MVPALGVRFIQGQLGYSSSIVMLYTLSHRNPATNTLRVVNLNLTVQLLYTSWKAELTFNVRKLELENFTH